MAWQKMIEAELAPAAKAMLMQAMPEGGGDIKAYRNDKYEVFVREVPSHGGWPDMVWLSIKRLDREPIHDWRDFQRMKNDIVGEDNEGVELYPSEKRLVDTSNQYHMWVLKDVANRFPFGFGGRLVTDQVVAETVSGKSKQRPLDE